MLPWERVSASVNFAAPDQVPVQIHPSPGGLYEHGQKLLDLMLGASGAEVRDYLTRLLDAFDTANGGSWLYIEIDPGFRWEAVEALFEFAAGLRGG